MVTQEQSIIEVGLGSFGQELVGSTTLWFQKTVRDRKHSFPLLQGTSGSVHGPTLGACLYDKKGIAPRGEYAVLPNETAS